MHTMHRIGLAVVIVAGTPAAMPAQVSLGLKGGLSFATLSNSRPDWKSRTGFAAGIALDLGGGLIGIRPEALYVQKGVEFDGSPSSASDAPQLTYVDVPVLVRVSIPIPLIQPSAYAGPSINFRLGCSYDGTDCTQATSSTDYGAVLGAGVRFGSHHGFTVEGRYTWGLKDIRDPAAGVKNQTRTFLILVGISL